LREVVQGKEEGLNSSGTFSSFIFIAMVEVIFFAN